MLFLFPEMKRWLRRLVLRAVLILLLTPLSLLWLPSAVAGAGVTVSIEVPAKVTKGADFIARVNISEVANFDAGNYDVSFNPTILKVTDVSSGRLGDTIIPVNLWSEETSGTVRLVQNIPGVSGVTGSGYLARIHFRALSQGISRITPSNGVLGDRQSQALPADWLGASVEVSAGEVTTEGGATPVVLPIVVLPEVTPAASDITEDGVFIRDVTAQSADNKVRLAVSKGTVAKDKTGAPFSQLSVTEMAEPPQAPANRRTVGLAYDLGPNGATFTPPITVTFAYDPLEIPPGVNEGDLVLTMWDEGEAGWVELPESTVDTVTHTVMSPVSHFTAFAIMAPVPTAEKAVPSKEKVLPPVEKVVLPEPGVVPSETKTVPSEPEEEEQPARATNWGLIGGASAAAVVGLLLLFLFLGIKRRVTRGN